ncbi:YncE family protein, partial [bacterium]|nr:YncE family protein [bacterium]
MKRALFFVLGLLVFSQTIYGANNFGLIQSLGMAKDSQKDIVWQIEKQWESTAPAMRSLDRNVQYRIQKYVYNEGSLQHDAHYILPKDTEHLFGDTVPCAVDHTGLFFAALSAAQPGDVATALYVDQNDVLHTEKIDIAGLRVHKIIAVQSGVLFIGQFEHTIHLIYRDRDGSVAFYTHDLNVSSTKNHFFITDAVVDSAHNVHMSCVLQGEPKSTIMVHFDYKVKKWTSNLLDNKDVQEVLYMAILPTKRSVQDQLVLVGKNSDGVSHIAWTDTQAKKAQVVDAIAFDPQALLIDSSSKAVVAGYDKTDFVCARYTRSGRYTKAYHPTIVTGSKKNTIQRSALFTGICEFADGVINADITYHTKDFYGITRDVSAPLVTAHVKVNVTDTDTPGTQVNDLYAHWNGYASVVSIRQLSLVGNPVHSADETIESFELEGFALVNELIADDTSDAQSLSTDPVIVFTTPAPGAAASATVTVTMSIDGQLYTVPLVGTMNIPVDFSGNPHVSGGIFSGTIPGTGGESLVLIVDPTDSVTAQNYSTNIAGQLDVTFDTQYVGVTVAAVIDQIAIDQNSVSTSWYLTGLKTVTFYTDEALENPVSNLTITVPAQSDTDVANTAERTFYLQAFVDIEPAGVPSFKQTNVPVTGYIILQTDDNGDVIVVESSVSISQDGDDVDLEGSGGFIDTQEGGYDFPNDDLGGTHTVNLTLGYNETHSSSSNVSNLSVLVDTVSDNHSDVQGIVFNTIRYNGISSYVQITHVVLDPETITDENTDLNEASDEDLHRWVLVNQDGYDAYQYDNAIDFFAAENAGYWALELTGDGYVLLGDAQYIHIAGTAYLLPPDSDTFLTVQLQGDVVASCDIHGNVTIPTISMFIDEQPTAVYQALYTSGLGVAQDMSVTIYVHPVDEEPFNAVAGVAEPHLDGSDIVPVDANATMYGRSRFDGVATRIDIDSVAIDFIAQPDWILEDITLGTDVSGVITEADTTDVEVEIFGTATLYRAGELTTVYSDDENPSDSAQFHDDADNGGTYDVLLRGTIFVNVDSDGNVSLAEGTNQIRAYHLDNLDGIDEEANRSVYTGRNNDIDIVLTVTGNRVTTIDQSVQNARVALTGTEKYNGDGSYILVTQATVFPINSGLDQSPTNALFNDPDWSYVYNAPVLSGDIVLGGVVQGDVEVDIQIANPTATVEYATGSITITSAAGTEFIRALNAGPELQIGADGVLSIVNDTQYNLDRLITDDDGGRFRSSTGIVCTHNGKLYITNGAGGEYDSGFITVIDTLNDYSAIILDDGFNQPSSIAYSALNDLVYVANPGGGGNSGLGFISVIDPKNDVVIDTIGADGDDIHFSTPVSLAVAPYGYLLYVVNHVANSISVIDIDPTHTIEQGYVSNSYNNHIATVSVGSQPRALQFSLDGTRLYVSNYGSNSISVINTSPLSDDYLDVLATISVAAGPIALALSASGFELFVGNYHDNSISVVDVYENSPSVYTIKNTFTTDINGLQSLAVWENNLYVTNNVDETITHLSVSTDSSVLLSTKLIGDAYNPFLNPQGLLVQGNSLFVVDAGDNGSNSYGQLFVFQISDSSISTTLNTDMILNLVPVDITHIVVTDNSTVSVDSNVTIQALYDGVTTTIKSLEIAVDNETISPAGWFAAGIGALEFNDGNDVIVLLSADGDVTTEPITVTGVASIYPDEDPTVIGGDGGTNQFLEVPVSGSVQFTVSRYGNITGITGSIGFTNQGPNADVTFTISVGTITNPATKVDYSAVQATMN